MAPAPAAKDKPSPAETAALKADLIKVAAIISTCDDAVGRAETASKAGEVYASYDAAHAADLACHDADEQAWNFDFSKVIRGDRRRLLKDITETCHESLRARGDHMAKGAQIYNGDTSPQAVNEMRELQGAADASSIQCAATMMGRAGTAGFDIPSVYPYSADGK